jgi:tetraacyldisaccharide 4'-kinase
MQLSRLDRYLSSDKRPEFLRKNYLFFLRILSWLYLAGYWFRQALYRFGILRPLRINTPVISVGNLSWGGTGKTPFVIYLASRLERREKRVVVLTRGYKRKSKSQVIVASENLSTVAWEECGDEPFLIAQYLKEGCVIVNPKRRAAARWAADKLSPDVFILDDGYQHLQLARDLDIVLIDSSTPLQSRNIMPLGVLREPLSALKRADLIVLSKISDSSLKQQISQQISSYYNGQTVETGYRLSSVSQFETEQKLEPSALLDKQVLAFCGIGNPNSFFQLLREKGLRVEKEAIFPDHYAYSNLDLMSLEREGLKLGIDYLVTTAKDALKLSGNLQLSLPVLIFHIEVEFISGEEALWSEIQKILEK